ncbi:hypothetical protein MYCOZU1_02828 [Mycobacterium intracellulare subsp. chimaera]|nr:hypothetical protein MYCODSM44623_02716 [Mycobacterium intracellulare subsp. chimaera]ASL21245.1 hypothetical protein MYCOZU1_02828 [Mycobacterium intracellulare subsp. chimaera]
MGGAHSGIFGFRGLLPLAPDDVPVSLEKVRRPWFY